MKRRAYQLSMMILGFLVVANADAVEPRPDVVLIVADNLGHGDLSCYGCPDSTRRTSTDCRTGRAVHELLFQWTGVFADSHGPVHRSLPAEDSGTRMCTRDGQRRPLRRRHPSGGRSNLGLPPEESS